VGKSAPKAPPPPDPRVVAQEQSAANIATAREQQKLNMVNSYGPDGSVVYQADPNAPGGYKQTTSLSPEQQAIWNAQKATELGAVNLANGQLGRVQTALETPLNTNGLPELSGGVDMSGLVPGAGIQTSFNKGGRLQYNFDPGQQLQGSVGGDLEAARVAAQNAVYQQAASRLDPRFQQEEQSLETRLANQGLSANSAAYENAKRQFQQGKNDAYNQAQYSAIQAGEQAAQGQFGRQLAQGQFANSAAGQQYQQNMGQAAFNNQTAGQDFSQNMGAAQFNNAAQQQGFNQNLQAIQAQLQNAQFGNQARNQGLQERAFVQNQPINQLTGLLGLGQVQGPQGVQYTPSQVAPTDVTGAYGLQQSAYQAAANRSAQQQSGLMGGLFTLGAAALMSDERTKTGIRRVGETDDGLPIYTYKYKTGGPTQMGVLAQEVRKRKPEAVEKTPSGMYAVDYGKI
jgi:hypothetical protein